MANSKISALTSASTPLAGTETLPIVQSSATVKVATNDLTVRNIRANATTGILQVTGPAAASTRVVTVPDANFTAARTDAAQSFTGDQTLSTGNLVIGTAGKGIDFSITSSGSGTMTSELLADYEEGTWTPTFTSTGATFTYNSQTGTYIKIGNLVYASFQFGMGAGASGTVTNAVLLAGLPFTAAEYGGLNNAWQNLSLVPTGIAIGTSIYLYGQGTITQLTPTTAGLITGGRYFAGVMIYSV